jgi:carbon-monoxide dehydrogenase large subunit
MRAFGTHQGGSRLEDGRFLTGRGRYVDDIAPVDALVAMLMRSPVAHGRIRALDVSAARAVPGVHLVLTSDDLVAAGLPLAVPATVLTNRDGTPAAAPTRPLLARDRVRHVGEPVALVVAENAACARAALEAINLTTEDLPVKLDLAEGGPVIHPEAPANLAYDWAVGDEGATAAAFAAAAHRVSLRVVHNRILVNSLEPRGAFAEWDGARLHLCFGGQSVWSLKAYLAETLGLATEAVRVTIPDVGGGFGMKSMIYPEYALISHAARCLGRPVRWMADRTEAMLSDHAGRDLIADAELAFDAGLRITGYRVRVLANLGAYNSDFGQPIQSRLFAKVLTGAYHIPAAWFNARGLYTNTTQVDAYRGAGRPEAILTLERAMDEAARKLGVDPFDLRRRNFIRKFPYLTASGETYDVGDFDRVLGRIEVLADVAGFDARRAKSSERGRLRGLGLAYYIESILGDPSEAAQIAFNDDGSVDLLVGTQSNGQGHETVYTRFLAERTGIPEAAIRVVQGDSDRIAHGGGTGGSRSVTVQTNAMIATIGQMTDAFVPFLAAETGAEGITFADGAFRAPGGNVVIGLMQAAAMARAAGRSDLLSHAAEARLPARSFPNGAHLAEVEIDPETGACTVDRYTVVDDFGTLVAPQLVEGQVHGGIAQGLGQAVMEQAVFDPTGQLLTGSFMDYAMPRASDVPAIVFATEPVPSTTNSLGMKGCGEAGTVGSIPAVANAVRDALARAGVGEVEMPFTPGRVWGWLQAARR